MINCAPLLAPKGVPDRYSNNPEKEEKVMYSFLRLAAVLSAAAMIAPLSAGTVVDVPSTGGGGFTNVVMAASWAQSDTHQGVTITAFITNPDDPTITATAWLTTAVGAGATPSDVIATTPITSTTLFTGLDLAPNTYYLVISLDTPNVANTFWMYDDPIQVAATTAPDVTLGNSYLGTFLDFPAFGPSEGMNVLDGTQFVFSVTDAPGSATPEPMTCLQLGSALIVIGGCSRRLRRNARRGANP